MNFHIQERTIDDLLMEVFQLLLKSKNTISPSKGPAVEEIGVLLELTNPLARISRTESRGLIFSCLGEFLWYLSKENKLEFIEYYIGLYKEYAEKDGTIFGGYGPRLFNMRNQGIDQFKNIIELLRNKPDTRQAVIQLFDASDLIDKHEDIPCTCTMQFMLRRNRLHMFTTMRSNDAFMGLPHDIFAFTMIQEIMAKTLDVELGTYKHAVGSLHLYDKNRDKAKIYIDESYQSNIPMPEMPPGDPWPSINQLLKVERDIRKMVTIDLSKLGVDPYWEDMIRLLQVYAAYVHKDKRTIEGIESQMYSGVYISYIKAKRKGGTKKAVGPRQLTLLDE